ncbi:GNAT family N-acetyltransferase (plasmid) [Aquamicrobium terrae]
MTSQPNTVTSTAAQAGTVDRTGSGFEVERFDRPSDIEREWRRLESEGVTTVFQRYDWVDSYVTHVLPHLKARPAIVLGRLHGQPAFILPLAISKVGPARMATWIGGDHSGYNFGLWSMEAVAAMALLGRAEIERMLGRALGDADCAVLARTPKSHDGVAQPLAGLPSRPSSTEGYSFDLAGGFDAVLKKTDGSRRRKSIRKQERKMGEFGVLRYATLRDPARAGAALDFFFEHKGQRLAEQGKADSFAEPGVQDFFHELLDRSMAMEEPILEMMELSVDGTMRAVKGSGIHRGRVNAYFSTYASDELVSYGPGRALLFRHVEECCERGLSAFDLGVGYEEYKTHWCDIIHELDDIYAAFTPLGSATIAAIRSAEAVKHLMRRNKVLWQYLKRARAFLSRRSSP